MLSLPGSEHRVRRTLCSPLESGGPRGTLHGHAHSILNLDVLEFEYN